LPSSNSRSSLPAEALQRYLQAPISLIDKVIHEKEAEAEQARIARDFAKLRKQQARRGGLIDFTISCAHRKQIGFRLNLDNCSKFAPRSCFLQV
jgi:hypothetical protein